MGTVIQFPEGQQRARVRQTALAEEPGAVIILPVIRIERLPDEPSDATSATAGRRRRRRASRS